jgi:hypothetical protein
VRERILSSNDRIALRKLPRDWGQILPTWARTTAVVVGLVVLIPLIFKDVPLRELCDGGHARLCSLGFLFSPFQHLQ